MDASGLSAGDQRNIYASVVNKIYVVTGVNKMAERLRSSLGIVTGTRLDDIGDPLRYGDSIIDQYPDGIGPLYNRGTPPMVVLATTDLVPTIPSPDLDTLMSLVIPFMLLVSMYLLRFRNARPMAALAIGLILAYAVASFLFIMDNLRFLLPAYLFAITVSLGAIREFWRHDRT
jgi:hypothetical protein